MSETIRIWRSPDSAFGRFQRHPQPSGEETFTALDAYTDDQLAKIAESGFNAIWVHGNMNSIVNTGIFPELGKDAGLHQQRLNALTERAGKHNLKVFVYCQPPRALPDDDPFWVKHPDAAGQEEFIHDESGRKTRVFSMCTSNEKVKTFLRQAGAELAAKVPELGGIIMITASEYPSHCWARRGRIMLADGNFDDAPMECPRCAERRPEQAVNEIIRLVRDGIRSVNGDWKIIAWNWSWTFYVKSPCPEIISALPDDVSLLVDFERGGSKLIAGKEREIDEYSLGFAGPSDQFMWSLEVARKYNIEVLAKLQFGTTHELATVPNLPAMGNVFAKADAVRKLGLAGFMGCWNFGNMITANTAGFNAFLSGRLPDGRDAALTAFASEYFPGCDGEGVKNAWIKFGEAMDNYPFSPAFLYSGPANFSFILPMEPAPLTGKPVGRSWLMDERGDDMTSAITGYTIDEIVTGFEVLGGIWRQGVEIMTAALCHASGENVRAELDNATVCLHMFRSIANFCKVYRLRREWSDTLLPEYRRIVADELDNLKAVLPILRRDRRFGYHIEAHGYQYDADGVAAKIEALQNRT